MDAFVTITWLSDGSQFEDQWICDESWLRILKRYFPLLRNEIDLCLSDVSRALATISIHGSNHSDTMIFPKTFSMNCPLSPGDRRRINFFYRSTNGIPPPDPSNSLVCNYANRESLPSTHYQSDAAVGRINVDETQLMHKGVTPQKNQTLSVITTVTPMREIGGGIERNVDGATRSVYWDSTEAAKLFGCTHGEDVFDCLVTHMKQLPSALQCSEAYKIIVVGGGDHMSQHDIFTIHNRCVVLRLAYIYAIERLGNSTMNYTRDWCGDSVLQCNNLGIVMTVSKRIL